MRARERSASDGATRWDRRSTCATATARSSPELRSVSCARRELAQRPVDLAAEFATHQVALGIGVRACVRRLIDQAVLVAFGIGEHRRVFFADPLFAKVVEAKIGDDAVDPGIERALKTEAAQVLVGL